MGPAAAQPELRLSWPGLRAQCLSLSGPVRCNRVKIEIIRSHFIKDCPGNMNTESSWHPVPGDISHSSWCPVTSERGVRGGPLISKWSVSHWYMCDALRAIYMILTQASSPCLEAALSWSRHLPAAINFRLCHHTAPAVASAVLHMLTIITHIIVISNHISIRNSCGKAATEQ